MSKLLERLMSKAEQKGVAVKNGRMVERDFGQVYKGDLEEQWKIIFTSDEVIQLHHWGTMILEVNLLLKEVTDFYVSSKSDRDGINFIINYYHLPYSVHYYPSKFEGVIKSL